MSNDSQMPDLSNVGDPTGLPQASAAPAQSYSSEPSPHQSEQAAAAQMATHLGKPVSGPGAIPPSHLSSLQDSFGQAEEAQNLAHQEQVEQHIPREPGPPDEPFKGHSFVSTEDLEQQVKNQQHMSDTQHQPSQQAPQRSPMSSQPTPMPNVLKSAPPSIQRSIQELFTIGMLRKRVNVAGFELQVKTLTSDEYQRAWAMASVFPEGAVREIALRQFILAFSITHINDTALEDLCHKPDINDTVGRRQEVLSRLDNELVRRFFEQGYLVVRDEGNKTLETVQEEASEIANFTQNSRQYGQIGSFLRFGDAQFMIPRSLSLMFIRSSYIEA